MAKFSALPLFTDAYLADTIHLTTLQHGAYLLMLMAAWRSKECRLPLDDALLARITGMDRRTWAANKPVIMAFWRVDSGEDGKQFCTQARLLDEYNYVEGNRNKNSAAGRASALKRLNRSATTVSTKRQPESQQPFQPNGNQQGNQNSTPSPSPSPSPSSASKDGFQLVDDALRKITGIENHPVFAAPVIAPIWQLVESGYDLRRQIIPSIARQIKSLNGSKSITAWKYFVPGIVEDAKAAMPAGANPAAVDDAKWGRLLENARNGPNGFKGRWDVKNYGPPPNQPGCRVPAALLKPGDGDGWTEWKPEP